MSGYDHMTNIGIISDKITDLNNFEFRDRKSCGSSKFCYGLSSCGRKLYHNVWQPQHYHYSAMYQEGDVITVHLDLDNKTVGFSRNDIFLGIAFRNIRVVSYRLAINVEPGSQHVFEFVDC